MKKALILLFIVVSVMPAISQKKKSKDPVVLSEEDKIKVEATLAEAEKHLLDNNQEKARELFEVVLKLDPNNGAANFKIAESLLQSNRGDQALPYAKAALDADRSNKYYFLIAAESHKAISDFKEAAKLYKEMIATIPGTESYLFDLAILHQYMGNFDEALEAYEQAEEIFGMNDMVLREKQKIYLKRQDYKSLIADWDELIHENPEVPRYTLEFSEFLISLGRFDDAESRLQNIVSVEPLAVLLLCEIALKKGDSAKAEDLARTALGLKNLDFKLKLELINIFLESAISTEQIDEVKQMAENLAKDYPKQFEVMAFTGDVMYRLEYKESAKNYYLKSVQLNPSSFAVWQNIVNIEAELNQYDSVIVHSETALEYFPNQAILYYFAGTGYLIQKEYKKSIQALESGKKYATDPMLLTIFYGQLGDAYNSLKQYEKCYQAYDKALENNPINDHVLNNYSYYLSLRKKDMEKAIAMSSKLVQMHPDNPTYLDTHGWVLYVSGNYKEALKFLEKAANMEEDGTVIEHYGDALFQLGRIDEAVTQWQRASKMSDTTEHIQKKIADRKLYE